MATVVAYFVLVISLRYRLLATASNPFSTYKRPDFSERFLFYFRVPFRMNVCRGNWTIPPSLT
jgi:hypothetical protein